MVHGLETLKRINGKGRRDPAKKDKRAIIERAGDLAGPTPEGIRAVVNAPWDERQCTAEQRALYGLKDRTIERAGSIVGNNPGDIRKVANAPWKRTKQTAEQRELYPNG